MEHHNIHQVHPGIHWQVLEEEAGVRTIRVGNKTARLYWEANALLLHILSGPGKGGTLYHRFEAKGPSDTQVVMSFEIPIPSWLRLLAPLVRRAIIRDIQKGLAEDKRDLETLGYPRKKA